MVKSKEWGRARLIEHSGPTMMDKRRGASGKGRALLLALMVVSLPLKATAQMPPAPVVVAPVVEREVQRWVQIVGTVEPNLSTTVGAEVAGRVERFDPREGDAVAKGKTVLAQLDRTPREIALREAEALVAKAKEEWEKLKRGLRPEEIAQRQAEVQQLWALLDWATKDLERIKALYQDGAISLADLQRAESHYLAAKSQHERAVQALRLAQLGPREEEIAQAEAEYRRALAAYERLDDELRRTTILAPISGFLVKKYVEVGAWVDPGDRIADLVDLDTVFVTGPVNEKEIGRIKVGDRAQIIVDAYPDRAFQGRVAHIVPQADPLSRAFPVKVRVDNPPGHPLKSGMFARIAIQSGGGRKGLFVPKDAVVRQGSLAVVFVVQDGVARARKVEIGRVVGGLVEVVNGALKPGQEVVVTGNESLQDGAKVQIEKGGRKGILK